jgi:hypothetical protein
VKPTKLKAQRSKFPRGETREFLRRLPLGSPGYTFGDYTSASLPSGSCPTVVEKRTFRASSVRTVYGQVTSCLRLGFPRTLLLLGSRVNSLY